MKYTAILSLVCLGLLAGLLTAAPAFAGNGARDGAETKKYSAVTADQFNKMLPGHTITGEYRFMRERTKTYTFSEAHHADGTTDYKEGPVKSKGIWYTLSRRGGNHKICYKYPNDPNMGPQTSCFWVYKQDTCYYGYSIETMTLKGPRNFEDWSARWVVKGSGGTCDAPIS